MRLENRNRARPLAVGGLLTVFVLAALLWPGYDAVTTPQRNAAVWAINADSSLYGKVNTAIGEVESVATVRNPAVVIQTSDNVLLFVDNYQKYAVIDTGLPADFGRDTTSELIDTPPFTEKVLLGGERLLFVLDDGSLMTSSITSPQDAILLRHRSDPAGLQSADEAHWAPLRADVAAITGQGKVVALVREAQAGFTVVTMSGDSGKVIETQTVTGSLSSNLQISMVEGRWVVLDVEAENLWIQGVEHPVSLELESQPRLRLPGRGAVVVADSGGLLTFDFESGNPVRTVTTPAGSAPAVPTEVEGRLYAAWLTPGEVSGTLWDSHNGISPLLYGGKEILGTPNPRITVSTGSAVLNDAASGWMWELPTGNLIPTSQHWEADAQIQPRGKAAQIKEVLVPVPPVARADTFGVRPGRDAVLPVLLNDYDANRDALSIVPHSIEGVDPSFGTVRPTNNNQELVVSVADTAQGSTTFSYAVTDGTSADGLTSKAASVTLSVVSPEQDSEPFFAGVGVDDYLGTWPTPTIAVGGVAKVQVLSGWVDPEGDPIFLLSGETDTVDAHVLARPDGTVLVRHLGQNAKPQDPIRVTVTVGTATGRTATKTLSFSVVEEPSLHMEPAVFAGVVGRPITIHLGDHVSGGLGPLRLVKLNPPSDTDELRVTAQDMRIVATASVPGSYLVNLEIQDSKGSTVEQTVRIVVSPPDEVSISAVPTTAFILPNEDLTVNLLDVVENPGGHPLLISDLEIKPEKDAELFAETVGEQFLHASGRTASGAPGKLGTVTYTVSDGSKNRDLSVEGEVTFMQAEEGREHPIVDDRWVTVSAGAQVDIPVLEWATGPVGSRLVVDQTSIIIDPQLEEADRNGGLAFATPSHIRYLAPKEPGEFSIGYSIYRLGHPDLSASAMLHVRVVEVDSVQLTLPPPLETRVLSGATVGIEPDLAAAQLRGEDYRLDTVLEQPKQGVAAVSADGESLRYTAHPNAAGADSFTYRVKSSQGQTVTGAVHVGILAGPARSTPVVYSRYIQTAVGKQSRIVVMPLDNAVNPGPTQLKLEEVWPNEPPGTAEYDAAQRRILKVDQQSGAVVLQAAEKVGSTSFFYRAQSESGEQATGMIVTKAVVNPVPDLPVIGDTKLTGETLRTLSDGVDVLTDRVTWSTGPAENLRVALWDQDGSFESDGTSIRGSIPNEAITVPFVVRGKSFAGEEARSFGFLKIPRPQGAPLALRETLPTPEVDEGGQILVDLSDAVVDPVGLGLAFDSESVAVSGSRPSASCTLEKETLTYTAGNGAPWADSCVIPVRMLHQETFTHLSLPISVRPRDPQPELLSAKIHVSPGRGTTEFDLAQMVDWRGGNQGGKPSGKNGLTEFKVTHGSDLFEIEQRGSRLEIRAKDDAVPTRFERIAVSLVNHPNVRPGTLTVVVGPAAGSNPRAGVVSKTCSSKDGQTSCVIPVIGGAVAGQVNFLPNAPLKLIAEEIRSPQNCPHVEFAFEDERSIRASWAKDALGRPDCTGYFSVQDAQGRRSTGAGRGTVVLELLGKPEPPIVRWVGSTAKTLSFQIAAAAPSYPAVETVRWSGNGAAGSCNPAEVCVVPVSEAALGARTTYRFWSASAAGESGSVAVEAWTYRPPSKLKDIRWHPNPDGTSVQIRLQVHDSDTRSVTVRSEANEQTVMIPASGLGWTTVNFDFSLRSHSPTKIHVTANSRISRPPAGVALPEATDSTVTELVHTVGAPVIAVDVRSDDGHAYATASVQARNGVGSPFTTLKMRLCAHLEGADPVCSVADMGEEALSIERGGPPGALIQFVAEAWGVGISPEIAGATFPVGEDSRDIRIGVPAPPTTVTYSLHPAGQQCNEGDVCYQWAAVDEPALGPSPEGGQPFFSFDDFRTGARTVGEVVGPHLLGRTWPELKVRNQAGGGVSDAVVVARRGPAGGRLIQRMPTDQECPSDPITLAPFQRFPESFGTVELATKTDVDQSVTHRWRLKLPSIQGVQFTAGGASALEWKCFVSAPLEEGEGKP